MRIALCGSAGTGKTSLGAALSRELGVPLLGEGMREHLERTGLDIHAIGHEGLRALVGQLWAERRAQEAERPGFVADRSAHEFAAFWLYYHFARDDEETRELLAECFRPDRYDHVFLLPWGVFPLVADGIRSPNPFIQLHYQLLLEGTLKRHCQPSPVELRETTLEGRLREVLGIVR